MHKTAFRVSEKFLLYWGLLKLGRLSGSCGGVETLKSSSEGQLNGIAYWCIGSLVLMTCWLQFASLNIPSLASLWFIIGQFAYVDTRCMVDRLNRHVLQAVLMLLRTCQMWSAGRAGSVGTLPAGCICKWPRACEIVGRWVNSLSTGILHSGSRACCHSLGGHARGSLAFKCCSHTLMLPRRSEACICLPSSC